VGVDGAGNVYIADTGNNLIRMVTPDGTIQTIAGAGSFAFAGDGGPAANASVNGPCFVLPDAKGNIWIADTNNHRIRKISPSGDIQTVAGNGTPGFTGDGGPATAAELIIPNALALDAAGNLYVADPAVDTIRKISPSGTITTFAGTPGVPGYTGDGGLATSAELWSPYGVAVDPSGNVLIADSGNNAIRLVTPNGVISSLQPPDDVLLPGLARALVADASGGFYFASPPAIGYAFQGAYPLPPLAPFVPWVGIHNAGFSETADIDGLGGAVAPGMIAAIYGNQLGPAAGLSATVDSSGTIGDNLGGVQVFFGGIAAPVLYAQSGQINVVAPFEIAGMSAVQVYTEYNGLRSNVNTLPVVPVFPSLFGSLDQVAAINQDGTINSSSSPAPVGSIVAVFATGGGLTDPVEADGTLINGALPMLEASVQAKFQYATQGAYLVVPAPTLVAGALQVNVQIPHMPGSFVGNPPTLIVYVGGASASGLIFSQ
jgi:uncharacterized protein (TIGR03437 family)